jgi:hypothetical protein
MTAAAPLLLPQDPRHDRVLAVLTFDQMFDQL